MLEQRHFHRIKFAVKTDIEINGLIREASLVDISLKGALVGFPDGFAPELGASCRLGIHLNFSDVILSFTGEVAHINDGLVGIKITLIDIDSMIHLRRLITLNSEDPEQVLSEIKSLCSFETDKDH